MRTSAIAAKAGNVSGWVRQVLLKGTDPSVDGQEELDAMADAINLHARQGWGSAIAAIECKETPSDQSATPHLIQHCGYCSSLWNSPALSKPRPVGFVADIFSQ
jgi:hypothetical protein